MRHILLVLCQMSRVTCRVSPVTCQLSLTPTATATDPPPGNSPIMTGLQNQKNKTKIVMQKINK